jgi:hypothetical protein
VPRCFTVIYDACVLYPAPLRDFLIELAAARLFRARWTEAIHEEWISNLLTVRPDLSCERLHRTMELMNQAIPDCLVYGYEYLIPAITLPDPDDRHVVAAAIHGGADAIVTFNLKDFPNSSLSQYELEAIHPDEFIAAQNDLDESKIVIAAQSCRERLINPPIPASEYLEILRRQGLPKTVASLCPFMEVI